MKREITNSIVYYLHIAIQEIICLHKARDSVESNAPSHSLYFSVPLWNSGIEADYRLPQYHITFPIVPILHMKLGKTKNFCVW